MPGIVPMTLALLGHAKPRSFGLGMNQQQNLTGKKSTLCWIYMCSYSGTHLRCTKFWAGSIIWIGFNGRPQKIQHIQRSIAGASVLFCISLWINLIRDSYFKKHGVYYHKPIFCDTLCVIPVCRQTFCSLSLCLTDARYLNAHLSYTGMEQWMQ